MISIIGRRSIKKRTDSIGAATESDDEIAIRKTSSREDKISQAAVGNQIPSSNFPNQAHPGYFHPYYAWPPTSAGPNQMPLPMSLVPPGYAAATAYPYQFGVVAPMPFVYAAAASGVRPAAVPHDEEVPVKDTAVDASKQDKRQAEEEEASTKRSLDADAGHDLLMSFAQRPMTDNVGGDTAYGVDGIHASSGGERCLVCAERRQAAGASFADAEFTASHRPLLDSHHLTDPTAMMKKHVAGRTFRNFTHGSGGGGGGEMTESRHSISSRTSRLVGFSRIDERPLKGSISQKLDQQISMLLEELEKSKDQNIEV